MVRDIRSLLETRSLAASQMTILEALTRLRLLALQARKRQLIEQVLSGLPGESWTLDAGPPCGDSGCVGGTAGGRVREESGRGMV